MFFVETNTFCSWQRSGFRALSSVTVTVVTKPATSEEQHNSKNGDYDDQMCLFDTRPIAAIWRENALRFAALIFGLIVFSDHGGRRSRLRNGFRGNAPFASLPILNVIVFSRVEDIVPFRPLRHFVQAIVKLGTLHRFVFILISLWTSDSNAKLVTVAVRRFVKRENFVDSDITTVEFAV